MLLTSFGGNLHQILRTIEFFELTVFSVHKISMHFFHLNNVGEFVAGCEVDRGLGTPGF